MESFNFSLFGYTVGVGKGEKVDNEMKKSQRSKCVESLCL